jgi:hypothetical protein
VAQSGVVRKLEFRLNGVLTNNLLWLKSNWGLAGRSRSASSLDGVAFTTFGEVYQFDWRYYRGNRSVSTVSITKPKRAIWMWIGFTMITPGRAGRNDERINL